jgi:hypothetical protein
MPHAVSAAPPRHSLPEQQPAHAPGPHAPALQTPEVQLCPVPQAVQAAPPLPQAVSAPPV